MPVVETFQNKPIDFTEVETDLTISLSGNVAGGGQSPSAANLRLKLAGDAIGRAAFVVRPAAPILTELAPGAFSKQFYTARLLDNTGSEIFIENASLEKPDGELGERVQFAIGRKDLSLITPDKTYTFQIGRWNSLQDALDDLPPTWETVIENGKLNSRSFGMAKRRNLPADTLSLVTIETEKNKLNRLPMKNFIFYDRSRIDVNLREVEKLYDSNGDYIRTQKFGYNSLTLYKIFNFICERCGFSGFETNFPNFQLIRVDFPYKKTYRESLSGYIGTYEPMYKVLPGGKLRIQSRKFPLPEDFEPVALTIDDFSQLSLNIPETTAVAGVELTYINSNSLASGFEDEAEEPVVKEYGDFGDPGFERETVTQTFRKWIDAAGNVVDRQLVKEITEKEATNPPYLSGLTLTDKETTEYRFDAQAKQTGMTQVIESFVPNLAASPPAAELQAVKSVEQTKEWAIDPRSTKRQYPARTVTRTFGMLAVDGENRSIGPSGNLQDYRQDFEKVYEHGNLLEDMTSVPLAPIETTIETLQPIGKNQYLFHARVRDEILSKTKLRQTDTRTGDASVNAVGGRSQQFIVWKEGISQANYNGDQIIELSGGEMPLEILIELAKLMIERRAAGFQDGSVTIPGFHKSLDRGTHFRITDRAGNSFGRFICRAVSTTFERLGVPFQQLVTTTVQISEV